MNPEELNKRLTHVEELLGRLILSDRYMIEKTIQMADGRNIQVGRGTGTKIATAPDQKLGFWGATPAVQSGAISAPSGGGTVDSQARSAITSIIAALHAAGITA